MGFWKCVDKLPLLQGSQDTYGDGITCQPLGRARQVSSFCGSLDNFAMKVQIYNVLVV